MNKEKKSGMFGKLVLVYLLVLCIVIMWGLCSFWQFLEEYEYSQPEKALAGFSSEMLNEEFHSFLLRWSESHASAFQQESEILQFLEGKLDESTLHLTQSLHPLDADTVSADIILMNRCCGKIILKRDDAEGSKFGFARYSVSATEWDITDSFSQAFTVNAPMDACVYVSGVLLSDKNCVVDEIPGEADPLTDDYKTLSRKQYTFRYFGEPDVTVSESETTCFWVSQAGNQFVVDATCQWDTCTMQLEIAQKFVEDYIAYAANERAYGYVLQHLVKDSDLYRRVTGSVEGMHWVNGVSSRISNFSVESCVPYGEAVICLVHYDLTYTEGYKYHESMRIMMVQDGENWKILNIEML